MPQVTVRLARTEEHQSLEALLTRAAMADEMYRAALLANRYQLTLPVEQIGAGQVFAADLEGRVVGVASVVFRNEGGVEIDGLFVEPELWRRGIGRALVGRCEGFARKAGASSLHALASHRSAAFYTAMGFQTVRAFENSFAPALVMVRQLD